MACKMLLDVRVQKKLKGNRVNDIKNRIQITKPVPRDKKERKTSIPESVTEQKKSDVPKPKRKTEKDLELENGGPGVFNVDLKKNYLLADPEWKYDIIPEIMDGKNVADFIDVDVEQRMAELEKEEELEMKKFEEDMKGLEDMTQEGESDLDDDEKDKLEKITEKKALIMNGRAILKTNNRPQIPRKYRTRQLEKAEEKLQALGLDTAKFRARSLSRIAKERGRKRTREQTPMTDGTTQDNAMATDTNTEKKKEKPSKIKSKSRERSRSAVSSSRTRSQTPRPGEGYRNVKQKIDAEKLDRVMQRPRNQDARKGEGDRRVLNLKPKWLFSGKRGKGSTDYR